MKSVSGGKWGWFETQQRLIGGVYFVFAKRYDKKGRLGWARVTELAKCVECRGEYHTARYGGEFCPSCKPEDYNWATR